MYQIYPLMGKVSRVSQKSATPCSLLSVDMRGNVNVPLRIIMSQKLTTKQTLSVIFQPISVRFGYRGFSWRGRWLLGANKSVFPSRDDQFWGVTPLTDAFMMEIEPSQN